MNQRVEQIIQEVPRDFHSSGSLSPTVLNGIVDIHKSFGAKVTSETGCGLTTLIFSHLSSRLTCFTIDGQDSLQNTRRHVLLKPDTTNFVVGPTQATLLS